MKPRVIITSDGLARGTKVVTESGEEIHGLRAVTIRLDVRDEPVTAHLELVGAYSEVKAVPVFVVRSPFDGKLKEVTSIRFADGTIFNA